VLDAPELVGIVGGFLHWVVVLLSTKKIKAQPVIIKSLFNALALYFWKAIANGEEMRLVLLP